MVLEKNNNTSNIANQEFSLHLIGNDFKDAYSQELKNYICNNQLDKSVFIYGDCNDIEFILSQASIGVLTSSFEGFPMAILEYANAKLCVISSNVGQISSIINNNLNGFLVESNNEKQLAELFMYIAHYKHDECIKLGANLYKMVQSKYSNEIVIKNYLPLITKI